MHAKKKFMNAAHVGSSAKAGLGPPAAIAALMAKIDEVDNGRRGNVSVLASAESDRISCNVT